MRGEAEKLYQRYDRTSELSEFPGLISDFQLLTKLSAQRADVPPRLPILDRILRSFRR